MQNSLTKIKSTLQEMNRTAEAEGQISNLEDKVAKKKEKKIKVAENTNSERKKKNKTPRMMIV